MNRALHTPFLVLLGLLSSAGCLNTPLDSGSAGGSTPTLGYGTTPGGSGASPDELGARFPGCGAPADTAAWQAEVVNLVNQERSARGLAPLARSTTLAAQAEQYACELIYYDFFAHDNPVTGTDLPQRAAEFSYGYWVIGENLAAGQPSPQEAVQSWLASAGHRANILSPDFTEIGVGVRTGGDFGVYWVQEFGRPR